MPDDEGLRAEVARLRGALEAERLVARQWREVAEERRASLERLRGDPALRRLLHAAEVVLPPLRRARRSGARVWWPARRLAVGALGAPYRLTAGMRERSLHERLDRLPPPAPSSRRVSVIVPTHDGGAHLARLLPALRTRTGHHACEVIVVDNGSGPSTRAFLDAQPDVRVLRSERNLSFSAANNLAASEATGDALVFLNDDVEPLSPGWLPRMLALLRGDVVAVGAQLVYPRRGLLDSHTRDVGVQHRGVDLRPVPGGMPKAVNVGGGADPDPGAPPAEVAAATAACLLVDGAALDAVGGFDEGYVYGAEDVDLCWRLRERGGRVMVAHDAVCLHPEGATRLRGDRPALRRRQARNWRRLAERHGPAMARAVALDRLDGRHVLSATPYRVVVTVPPVREAGRRDAALRLAAGLRDLDWQVRTVTGARAPLGPPGRPDAVVATSPGGLRAGRPGATTVALVAGYTADWLSAPGLDDADAVLAAGEETAAALREHG
ncbi:MAG: glycosyltransferase family 2 protein, partial [Actinobacteria bacterium]|nr:glycosyltransferase family 2 protein [Actinomycetota bacterium]